LNQIINENHSVGSKNNYSLESKPFSNQLGRRGKDYISENKNKVIYEM